ncbi:MAG: hypothetical protein AAFV29_27030, partial [Myxococcota bacterium]
MKHPIWLLLVLVPAPAMGQGLSTPLVGTGRSSAATADASAVFYNPAMTAFMDRPQLQLGAMLVAGHIGYRRDYRGIYQTPDALDFALPIAPDAVDF